MINSKETEINRFRKIVQILMQLDENSLILIDSGAKLLAARQEMEKSGKRRKGG